MLIKEITESISVTRYETVLVNAARSAICKTLGSLYDFKNEYSKEQAELDSDDGDHKQFEQLMKQHFRERIQDEMIDTLEKKFNQAVGWRVVNSLSVGKDIGVNGLASGRDIVLNAKFLEIITKRVMDKLFNALINSYNGNERSDGFFYMVRMLGQEDRLLKYEILYNTDKIINRMISTFLHEVVHVQQHGRQAMRPGLDTEYRSYLDKTKGEFSNLHSNEWNSSDGHSERWWNLYLSSPQEIAAIAHQVALEVIRAYGFNEATSIEELDIKNLRAQDIGYKIDEILYGRFKDSNDPRERRVRQRYFKLAYKEVVAYLRHKVQTIEKQSHP